LPLISFKIEKKMMKNGKISHFFKRKACENASTSEPVEVPRINEMITSTPQQVEVPPIEEVTIATPQQVEVPSIEEVSTTTPQQIEVPSIEEVTITSQRVVVPDDILNFLERDPSNQVDQIRRAYMKCGLYQILLEEYPLFGIANHLRRFQET
jgi:hypothetical protein